MAGKIVAEESKTSAEMSMTPMIDCVFQLIIFFMVCTEVKQSEDADVQLPVTRYAVLDIHPPFNRVVINCVWIPHTSPGGDYKVTERIEVRNHFYDQKQLQDYLELQDRNLRMKDHMSLDKTSALSKLFIKIRADARCKWSTVQMAQMACTMAGIYQVSYGTKPAIKTE
ncbi:MAG: ExbD/TolR family protein [Planctomycetota bacterium]